MSAIKQVRQRLAAMSTDAERRKAGVTHSTWQWIHRRVTMDHDECARRRRYFRLCVAIPGSKAFMPRIPSLGCAYAPPGSVEAHRRKIFW